MTEKLKVAARQALEALCRWSNGLDVDAVALNDLIDELDAALAEQTVPSDYPHSHQPVAWLDQDINASYTAAEMDGDSTDGLVPLYTAPPQRDALLEALRHIANHDLRGADLTACGHIAHALIGKARDAIKAVEDAPDR